MIIHFGILIPLLNIPKDDWNTKGRVPPCFVRAMLRPEDANTNTILFQPGLLRNGGPIWPESGATKIGGGAGGAKKMLVRRYHLLSAAPYSKTIVCCIAYQNTSELNCSWALWYFIQISEYNHAHYKLIYLELFRTPNGRFKCLVSGGGFISVTAVRQFQQWNGRLCNRFRIETTWIFRYSGYT